MFIYRQSSRHFSKGQADKSSPLLSPRRLYKIFAVSADHLAMGVVLIVFPILMGSAAIHWA